VNIASLNYEENRCAMVAVSTIKSSPACVQEKLTWNSPIIIFRPNRLGRETVRTR
jgi:hypothetical protein